MQRAVACAERGWRWRCRAHTHTHARARAAATQISGGEWKQELLFTVPREHPEVERLEGRYKK
jgi:hypothetical protein